MVIRITLQQSYHEIRQFYVWSKSEIKNILGDDAELFCLYYDVTDGGNWEGKNILCNNINISTVAFNFGITDDKVKEIISSSSKKLLDVRSKRISPGLDDKILTSWNALMITALAKGYRVTEDVNYLNAAKNCITFFKKLVTSLLASFRIVISRGFCKYM